MLFLDGVETIVDKAFSRVVLSITLSHKLLQTFLNLAQKLFKSCLKVFNFLKRFLNLLVNTAIFAFFHKTGCRWWSTLIHFQVLPFALFVKRVYCGWRSNLQQLKVNNISHRQIFIEANRKKISFHSPSIDIIKNCIPHIVWEEETKPVTVIFGEQEVGREKPFEINIFFSDWLSL